MGNAECGVRNGERGVRNGERGVRNGERGMRSSDPLIAAKYTDHVGKLRKTGSGDCPTGPLGLPCRLHHADTPTCPTKLSEFQTTERSRTRRHALAGRATTA